MRIETQHAVLLYTDKFRRVLQRRRLFVRR
jgi:hypothetical protein